MIILKYLLASDCKQLRSFPSQSYFYIRNFVLEHPDKESADHKQKAKIHLATFLRKVNVESHLDFRLHLSILKSKKKIIAHFLKSNMFFSFKIK